MPGGAPEQRLEPEPEPGVGLELAAIVVAAEAGQLGSALVFYANADPTSKQSSSQSA